ncbi:hypothetical protein ACFVQ3_18825, partial [Oerskovia sp. NPDC057915]|uniref:hypothetical protein n=1 Tax=Oerskovia sp. NPDC057915 TaxID=3346280 RepID=UPI0036DECC98
MVGVLGFSALGVPVTAAADTVPADVSCAGSAASAVEATLVAASCDREVEVVSERTAWDTVFATPEG